MLWALGVVCVLLVDGVSGQVTRRCPFEEVVELPAQEEDAAAFVCGALDDRCGSEGTLDWGWVGARGKGAFECVDCSDVADLEVVVVGSPVASGGWEWWVGVGLLVGVGALVGLQWACVGCLPPAVKLQPHFSGVGYWVMRRCFDAHLVHHAPGGLLTTPEYVLLTWGPTATVLGIWALFAQLPGRWGARIRGPLQWRWVQGVVEVGLCFGIATAICTLVPMRSFSIRCNDPPSDEITSNDDVINDDTTHPNQNYATPTENAKEAPWVYTALVFLLLLTLSTTTSLLFRAAKFTPPPSTLSTPDNTPKPSTCAPFAVFWGNPLVLLVVGVVLAGVAGGVVGERGGEVGRTFGVGLGLYWGVQLMVRVIVASCFNRPSPSPRFTLSTPRDQEYRADERLDCCGNVVRDSLSWPQQVCYGWVMSLWEADIEESKATEVAEEAEKEEARVRAEVIAAAAAADEAERVAREKGSYVPPSTETQPPTHPTPSAPPPTTPVLASTGEAV